MTPGLEIVLVEDNLMLRAALGLALRREGFIVHGTGVLQEAIDWLRGPAPIVAMITELDLGRGGEEGLEMLTQVRNEWPGLAIIVLTGRPGLLLHRRPGPREAHLLKPCPVSRLTATLRDMIHGGGA